MATLEAAPPGDPHYHAESTTGVFFDASPPASKMIAGYLYDSVTGIAILNAPADVRSGTPCGNEGNSGTLAVAPPQYVLAGIPTDDTEGTLLMPEPPAAADLRAGVVNGEIVGTLVVAAPSDVRFNVPTDDTFGTLTALSVPAPLNASISLPPPPPRGLHYA